MANLVRIKTTIIIISIITVVVSLINLKFKINNDRRIKYWSPDSTLSSNDFRGIIPAFEKKSYGASLFVAFKINERNGIYYVEPIIDKYQSFIRKEDINDKIIKHEKYHANIAAIYANEMNNILKDTVFETPKFREDFFNKYYQKHFEFQKKYDLETKHGKNSELQNYWEYKIDSTYYSNQKLNTIDKFSGISAFFPAQPSIGTLQDTFDARKWFSLARYDMQFSFFTDYDKDVDNENIKEHITKKLIDLGNINITSKEYFINGRYYLSLEYEDTIKTLKHYDLVIYEFPHTYYVLVHYPLNYKVNEYYELMKNNFFNSIEIKNYDNYWVEIALNKSERKPIKEIFTSKYDSKYNHSANKTDKKLIVNHYGNYSIIYHNPIFYENKLIIPFNPIKDKIEEIDEVLLIVNNEMYFSQEPDSLYQIIVLDLEYYKIKDINKLQFGYTLKRDSIEAFYQLKGTIL